RGNCAWRDRGHARGAHVEPCRAGPIPQVRLHLGGSAEELLPGGQRGRAGDVGAPGRPAGVRGAARLDRAHVAQRDRRRRRATRVALILGIETSCDETAAAVVADGHSVCSSVVSSQVDLHARFGGVVPEVASRAHVELITPVIAEALIEAGVELSDLDAVAACHGPGLAGALLVGVAAAKALALAAGLPYVGVNHLEAHLHAAWLEDPELTPPLAVLIVSGGHTMSVIMEDHGRYRVAGQTVDDAAGE